jgi:hypothetical protein
MRAHWIILKTAKIPNFLVIIQLFLPPPIKELTYLKIRYKFGQPPTTKMQTTLIKTFSSRTKTFNLCNQIHKLHTTNQRTLTKANRVQPTN